MTAALMTKKEQLIDFLAQVMPLYQLLFIARDNSFCQNFITTSLRKIAKSLAVSHLLLPT